jgi:hypothetical protein
MYRTGMTCRYEQNKINYMKTLRTNTSGNLKKNNSKMLGFYLRHTGRGRKYSDTVSLSRFKVQLHVK